MPVVEDPDLRAKEKLERFFEVTTRWKTDNKMFLLALLRTWYNDDNAIVRQKMTTKSLERISGGVSVIIRQGVEEGTFNTPYPNEIGEVIWAILINFGEVLTRTLLTSPPVEGFEHFFKNNIVLYTGSVERVLGAKPGSLKLIDLETMMEWVEPAGAVSSEAG